MKHLLLLHGAIGSKDQLSMLETAFSKDFEVSSINFSGHGGEREKGEFSIELFANEVLQWMKSKEIEKISVFGYSMGGYVALFLARHHPQAVESIITLGTKFKWDETIAQKEVSMLNPDVIEQKVPTFAKQLAQRHYPADWKQVLQKTANMLKKMGESNPLKEGDYKSIQANVLLLIGDRDKMVSLDETVSVFSQLPAAQLGVLPDTPHTIETIDTTPLVILAKRFLQ